MQLINLEKEYKQYTHIFLYMGYILSINELKYFVTNTNIFIFLNKGYKCS